MCNRPIFIDKILRYKYKSFSKGFNKDTCHSVSSYNFDEINYNHLDIDISSYIKYKEDLIELNNVLKFIYIFTNFISKSLYSKKINGYLYRRELKREVFNLSPEYFNKNTKQFLLICDFFRYEGYGFLHKDWLEEDDDGEYFVIFVDILKSLKVLIKNIDKLIKKSDENGLLKKENAVNKYVMKLFNFIRISKLYYSYIKLNIKYL